MIWLEQWMRDMLVPSCCSIYRQHSTLSIMSSWWKFWKNDSDWKGKLMTGSAHTSVTGSRLYVLELRDLLNSFWPAASRKDQFSGQNLSWPTPKMWPKFSNYTKCNIIILYADDMQSHAHSKPSEFTSVITKLQNCAVAVSDWCRSKRLQLNAKKTELHVLRFCHQPPENSRSHEALLHRKWDRWASECGPRSWSIVWWTPQHEGAYFEHFAYLLLSSATTSIRSSSAWSGNHSTASFCICSVKTRLLQCSSSWITGCYSCTSSTGAECFSSVDPGLETTRSRHSSVERTALAPDQTEDRIQTLSSRLLVDQRPSSVLSSRQVDICVGSSWSCIVAFRTDQESWRSSNETETGGEGVPGRCSHCMEQIGRRT